MVGRRLLQADLTDNRKTHNCQPEPAIPNAGSGIPNQQKSAFAQHENIKIKIAFRKKLSTFTTLNSLGASI